MSMYQIIWYFIIYAFLGWVTEVIYHAVHEGRLINRGFLTGPVCPVYGFGMIAVISMYQALPDTMSKEKELVILFAGGMILASAVELFAGWILDEIFHVRWWDYSSNRFNFHGYICLEFSLLWGLGTVFMLYAVVPLVTDQVDRLFPESYGQYILGILYMVLLVDLVYTVLTVQQLNQKLRELDEIARSSIRETGGEYLRMLKGYRQVFSNKLFGMGRLVEAFPGMRHRQYDRVMAVLNGIKAQQAAITNRLKGKE